MVGYLSRWSKANEYDTGIKKRPNAIQILGLFVFTDLHPNGRVYQVFLVSGLLICFGLAFFFKSHPYRWVVGSALLFLGLVIYFIHRLLLRTARKSISFKWLGIKEHVSVFLFFIVSAYLFLNSRLFFLPLILFVMAHLICIWRINGVKILKILKKQNKEM